MIKIHQLSKSFYDHLVLENISLEVASGTIYGLIVRRRFDFLSDDTFATFYFSTSFLLNFYTVSCLTTYFHLITLTILFRLFIVKIKKEIEPIPSQSVLSPG